VRRWWALGAVCLGAFLLTGAAMLRWYAAPLAARLPVDPDLTVTLVGAGLAYDPAAGTPVGGALRESLTVRGDPGAGSATVAVWAVDRRLTRADGTLVAVAGERVALDRETAVAVGCCGERPRHAGLSYAFPAGVAPADVGLYDPDTGRPQPARYAGEDTVAGLPAYRFEQVVPDTDVGSRPLPGAPPVEPVGAGTAAREGPRTGRVTVAGRRTLWVEPVTGTVVRLVERRQERIAWPGRGTVVLLVAELSADPASVDRLAGLARDRRGRLLVLRRTAPAAAAGTGGMLLLVGVGYRIVTVTRSIRA
jgi:Porin PorA